MLKEELLLDKHVYLYLIFGLLIILLVEILLRRKYNTGFHRYRPVDHIHKWIERILVVLFIIGAFFVVYFHALYGGFLVVFAFSAILGFLRAYMEYHKGVKEEKKYIIQLLVGGCYTGLFVGPLILLP